MSNQVRQQYLKFVNLRRKLKFEPDTRIRYSLMGQMTSLQIYSDLALDFNKNLTSDEIEMLNAIKKINVGKPNDKGDVIW